MELIHHGPLEAFCVVNNAGREMAEAPAFTRAFSNRIVSGGGNPVNKPVYKFALLKEKYLIPCFQFIERAEMGRGGQQIAVEYLKDDPR